MRVLWIHLPGLTESRLAAALPQVPAPTHRARLVPGFPWWPASVYASMRSGLTPAGHSVLRSTALGAPQTDDLFARTGRSRREIDARTPGEWLAAIADGQDVELLHLRTGYAPWSQMGPFLDCLPEVLRPALRASARVLLSGDLPRHEPARMLRVQDLPAPSSEGPVEAFERVALYRHPGPGWGGARRDAILHRVGVQRILEGRGLELFGVEPAQWLAVVLAPGLCLGDEGPPPQELSPVREGPGLWAWTDPSLEAWTPAVHDYRVAATLLAALEPQSPAARLRGPEAPLPL